MRTDDIDRAWTIMGRQLQQRDPGRRLPGQPAQDHDARDLRLGVRDPIVRQDLVPALRRLKPEMEIRRIPGLNANHFMLLNIPDVVAREVMRDEVDHLHFPHRSGAGQPMALLHGQAASSQYWRPFTDALVRRATTSPSWTCSASANSPKPLSFEYSLDDHVRLLQRTLHTRFSRKPLRLVGQSMGSHHRARLRGEVSRATSPSSRSSTRPCSFRRSSGSASPAPTWAPRPPSRSQATIGAVRDRVNETLDRDFASQIGGDAYEQRAVPAMRSIEEVVAKQDVPALLDQVKVPVKFVYATDDPAVVPAFIEALEAAYDNVTAVELPGDGQPARDRAGGLAGRDSARPSRGDGEGRREGDQEQQVVDRRSERRPDPPERRRRAHDARAHHAPRRDRS